MSYFGLPSHWVYVLYADGSYENVANSDVLTEAVADAYRAEWENARKKKVSAVMLMSGNHYDAGFECDPDNALKCYWY